MGQAQTQAADSSAAAAADEKSSKPFLSEFLESGTCAHCRATGAGFIGHTCDICDKRLCRRCMPHQHTTIDGVTEPRVEGDPTGGDTIARAASKQRGRAVWMCHKCVVTTLPFLSAAPELPTLHPAVVTAPPDVEGIDRPLMEGDGGFVANGFQFSLAKRLAALCSLSYDRETTLAVPTSWGVDGVQTFAGPGRGSMFGFICAASPAWTAEMGLDPDTRAFVVVFRGTCTLDNVAKDLNASTRRLPPGMLPVDYDADSVPEVHGGFLESYLSVRLSLLSLLRPLLSSPSACVCITGHSLGGAAATLAALDIATNLATPSPTGGRVSPRVCVYTFGQPRTGDEAFLDLYHRVIPRWCHYRVANLGDIVTKLPTWSIVYKYKHVGTLVSCVKTGEHSVLPTSYVVRPSKETRSTSLFKIGVADHLLYMGCPFPDNPLQLHNE